MNVNVAEPWPNREDGEQYFGTTSGTDPLGASARRSGAAGVALGPAAVGQAFLVPSVGPSLRPVEIGSCGRAERNRLRQLMVGLDLVAAFAAWATATWLSGGGDSSAIGKAATAGVLALATVVLAHTRRLYRAGVCALRAFELQRVGQVALLLGALTFLAGPKVGFDLSNGDVLLGTALTFLFVNTLRTGYRSWLASARGRGRFQRPVVIVGTGEESTSLFDLVRDHPQLGLRVVGVIGDDGLRVGLPTDGLHLGPVSRTDELVASSGASGALIVASALSPAELNRTTRSLLDAGVHVHLWTGLRGFASHRIQPQSLAHEPVLYLEPLRLARWQVAAKRALDLVVGTSTLLLSLPIMAIAALAIKLDDGGPIIFRQTRVGRGGKHFTMLKLRTMAPGSEALYGGLAGSMAGRSGPLVKLYADPRITRVGRVLRATSIDELPQLFNVLRGSMSLIGPRPNLLLEAEGIDPVFLAHKAQVRPGMSGLWQVEARDNPSYNVYRRLDVFYLENWSMSLDLAILLVTMQRVVGRAARVLIGRLPQPEAGC